MVAISCFSPSFFFPPLFFSVSSLSLSFIFVPFSFSLEKRDKSVINLCCTVKRYVCFVSCCLRACRMPNTRRSKWTTYWFPRSVQLWNKTSRVCELHFTKEVDTQTMLKSLMSDTCFTRFFFLICFLFGQKSRLNYNRKWLHFSTSLVSCHSSFSKLASHLWTFASLVENIADGTTMLPPAPNPQLPDAPACFCT